MNNNPFLASFKGTDALVSFGSESSFAAYLDSAAAIAARIEGASSMDVASTDVDFWFAPDDWRSVYRPYNVSGGVLFIPVKGVLLHGMGYALGAWATGYTYLSKAIARGLQDDEVKSIALVIDSGGGHVSGCFDIVDAIYAGREVKPIHAIADEHAYSAAYAIASAATSVTVARTGGAGSIGTLRVHYDETEALAMSGRKVTFIQSGKHKTDGHHEKALTPQMIERMEARSSELYEIFVSTVARNRAMDANIIRETEAMTYSATEALANGLIDAIGTLDDVIAATVAQISNDQKDEEMAITKEEMDTAVANAKADGVREGMTQGATGAINRFNAILNSDEAKARPKAAMTLASNPALISMDQTAVIEMLGSLPEEASLTPATPVADAPKGKDGAAADFQSTMDAAKHPELGSSTPKTPEQTRAEQRKAALVASGRVVK